MESYERKRVSLFFLNQCFVYCQLSNNPTVFSRKITPLHSLSWTSNKHIQKYKRIFAKAKRQINGYVQDKGNQRECRKRTKNCKTISKCFFLFIFTFQVNYYSQPIFHFTYKAINVTPRTHEYFNHILLQTSNTKVLSWSVSKFLLSINVKNLLILRRLDDGESKPPYIRCVWQ